MSTPADDVAALIESSSLGWILGTNLFVADVQPVVQTQGAGTGTPSKSVFVLLAGGYDTPTRYIQGNYSQAGVGVQAREPRVMIYIRSSRQQYLDGITSSRAVKNQEHYDPVLIGSSGLYYDACRIVEAEPMLLTQTDNGEFLFSLNCHLWLDA